MMFIRVDILKDLVKKADPTRPFKIIIECDNQWTKKDGATVMEGPKTIYRIEQEGLKTERLG